VAAKAAKRAQEGDAGRERLPARSQSQFFARSAIFAAENEVVLLWPQKPQGGRKKGMPEGNGCLLEVSRSSSCSAIIAAARKRGCCGRKSRKGAQEGEAGRERLPAGSQSQFFACSAIFAAARKRCCCGRKSRKRAQEGDAGRGRLPARSQPQFFACSAIFAAEIEVMLLWPQKPQEGAKWWKAGRGRLVSGWHG